MAADVTRPALAWFAVLDGGLVTLAALAASPTLHERVRARVPLPSRSTLRSLLVGTALVHVGEAVSAHRTATRHGLPGRPWATQTFVVGFPSLLALRKVTAEG